MKVEAFQKILTDTTAKTKHVRACSKPWSSGIDQIDEDIINLTHDTAAIVSFLEDKINEGLFCKQNEFIMIYNFQRCDSPESAYFCSLDMVIRPISEINDLNTIIGKELQLVVEGRNGLIVNNSYVLEKLEMLDEDIDEPPFTYGNYAKYVKPEQEQAAPIAKPIPLTVRLEVLQSYFSDNSMSGELKDKIESDSPKSVSPEVEIRSPLYLDLRKPITPITYVYGGINSGSAFDSASAFDRSSLLEAGSPSTAPSLLAFALADSPKNFFETSSLLSCKA